MSRFSDILNTQEPFSMKNLWTALRGTQTPVYKIVPARGNAWAAQATAISEEDARQRRMEAARLQEQEAARLQEQEAARLRAIEEAAAQEALARSRMRNLERESRHSEKLSKAIKEKARGAAKRLYHPYSLGDYVVVRQEYSNYNWYTAGQIVGISGRVFDIRSPDGYSVSVLDKNIIGPITALNAREFTRFQKYTRGGSRRKHRASKLKRTRKQ